MADQASENTKAILCDVLRIEMKAFDPAMKALQESLSGLLANPDAIGAAASLKDASEKMAAAAKVKARAMRVLTGEETGTRNTAGGAVKAVRSFTGRNMLAEIAAAYDAAHTPAAETTDSVAETTDSEAETTGSRKRR